MSTEGAQPGGGKYDRELNAAMESTKAACVMLIVFGGDRGNGFSVAMVPGAITPKDIVAILRDVANGIEKGGEN